MNATIDIKIGVLSRKRQWDEPFKPTISYSSDWHWSTDLDHYAALTPGIATSVYAHIAAERESSAVTTTHVAVRLDNPTHPTPAAGVVPLAKGHRDCSLTDLEIPNANTLTEFINTLVGELKSQARY